MWWWHRRMRKGKKDGDSSRQPNIWALGVTLGVLFFFGYLMKIADKAPSEAVALAGIVVGCAAVVIPFWLFFRYKHSLQKSTPTKDPAEEGKMKRLEERMENLEMLICRMDSE